MKREEILVNCIDDIQAGRRTLAECIARYPGLASDLQGLTGVLNSITVESVAPSAEFKRRLRSRLIEVMESTEAERSRTGSWFKFVPLRKLNYALALVSVLLVAGSGTTVYASQGSLPGEPLYPVKTGVEKVQLALALTPESKASLHLRLADRRIEEVVAESNRQQVISTSALEAAAAQIDNAISDMKAMPADQVSGLLSRLSQTTLEHQASLEQVSKTAPETAQAAVRQAIDATRRGNLIAQVASGNPRILGAGASALDDKLESAYFEISGRLVSVDASTWNVGGVLLKNVVAPQGLPPIGSSVEIKGMVRDGQTFVSKIEREDDAPGETSIKGIFGGSSAGGTVWNVGGITVGEFRDVAVPQIGTRLQVKGTLQNGVFTISGMAGKKVEPGESKAGGVLQKVDTEKKTIAVDMAGTKVTINVAEAEITDNNGQTLALNDMESTVGKDVQASSIYKSDDKFYARNIHVDAQRPEPTKGASDKPGSTGGKSGEVKDKPGDTGTKPGEDKDKRGDNDKPSDASKDRQGDTGSRSSDSKDRQGDTGSRSGDSADRQGDTGGRSSDSGDRHSGTGDRSSQGTRSGQSGNRD